MPFSGSFRASGNISPSRFVTSDGNPHGVVQAAANDRITGVAQQAGREPPLPSVSTIYAAQSGDSLNVHLPGDCCWVEVGGAVNEGDLVKSDADGKAVAASTSASDQNIGGLVLIGNSGGAGAAYIQVMRDSARAVVTS